MGEGGGEGESEHTHTHTNTEKMCVAGEKAEESLSWNPPPPLLNHYPFLSVSPGKGIMVVKIKEQKTYQIPHM